MRALPPLGRLVAAIRADHPSMAPQALIGRARSIVNLAGCCSHVPCAAESGWRSVIANPTVVAAPAGDPVESRWPSIARRLSQDRRNPNFEGRRAAPSDIKAKSA